MNTFLLQVTSDGHFNRIPFDPANSYKQLKAAVGGFIELVPTGRDIDLFCNEEGKVNCLAFNAPLTRYYQHSVKTYDYILGRGVFCKHDADGETIGLTKWECADIENEIRRLESGKA